MEPSSNADLPSRVERPLMLASWLAVAAFCVARFLHLSADFPNNSPWMIDQAKFTDEGWWAGGAIAHHLSGHWIVPGDYNPVVAVPVWPALLSLLFHVTGISVVAARALNVVLSVATLGVAFALIRRCAQNRPTSTATFAVLLLACSPFAYGFSRLATLETIVALEFCLIMLLATFASDRRILYVAMPLLIAAMMLTKTTALVLLPAILWLTWHTASGTRRGLLSASISVFVIPATLFKAYAAIIFNRGFGDDYNYFFAANDAYDMDWNHLLRWLLDILHDGFWIDRILFPAMFVSVLYAIFWKRSLWQNPLFAASCFALAGQIVFLLGRSGDVAPRYFVIMLFPVVFLAALALDTLHYRVANGFYVLVAVTVMVNTATIIEFQRNRSGDYMQAAVSIRNIVESDPAHNHLLLGVTAGQISLMTGLPSINDVYGTEPLPQKVLSYQPGWYVACNRPDRDQKAALEPFRMDEVARYHVFDNEHRNTIILYRLAPR